MSRNPILGWFSNDLAIEHDSTASYVNQGIGSTEINGQIVGKPSQYRIATHN